MPDNNVQIVNIDKKKDRYNYVKYKQGSNANTLIVNVYDNGTESVLDIGSNYNYRLIGMRNDNYYIFKNAKTVKDNVIEFEINEYITCLDGKHEVNVAIYDTNNDQTYIFTNKIIIYIERNSLVYSNILTSDEQSALNELIQNIENTTTIDDDNISSTKTFSSYKVNALVDNVTNDLKNVTNNLNNVTTDLNNITTDLDNVTNDLNNVEIELNNKIDNLNLGEKNIQSDWNVTDSTNNAYIKNKPTLFSGSYTDLTNKPTLFSGSYEDLSNKPTIPNEYTLPTASTSTLGGVKIDGTTITITDGVISSVGGTSSGNGVGDNSEGDTVTIKDAEGNDITVTCAKGAELFNCYEDYIHNKNNRTYKRNIASGLFSHAEGGSTESYGFCSHAEGEGTIANGESSHVSGKYNIEDNEEKYAVIVGNGYWSNETYSSVKSNAYMLDWDGNIILPIKDSGVILTDSDGTECKVTASLINSLGGGASDGTGDGTGDGVGGGVGENTTGDVVNVYDSSGTLITPTCGEGAEIFNSYKDIKNSDGEITTYRNTAIGIMSHAEGNSTVAFSDYTHTEGFYTCAYGKYAHSEGFYSYCDGNQSHAEGYSSYAHGESSHAEGGYTQAKGTNSHAEGYNTIANGENSHAEGFNTVARGDYQHVSGRYNDIDNDNRYAVIVGNGTETDTSNAFTLDWDGNIKLPSYNTGLILTDTDGTECKVTASLINSLGGGTASSVGINTNGNTVVIDNKYVTCGVGSEIFNSYTDDSTNSTVKNIASGIYSHAEGASNIASGKTSHAEGCLTQSYGENSHAEGWKTSSSGFSSHAEGNTARANGSCCHAEGFATYSIGAVSHAEGNYTTANGENSHTEGDHTTTYGAKSHAEGFATIANGIASHAEGCYTKATADYSHVSGKYNIEDTENKYAVIVGNGDSTSNLSNAYMLDWEGNITLPMANSGIVLKNTDGTECKVTASLINSLGTGGGVGDGGSYTLPTASTTELGGVKIDGTTITITDGVISSVGGTGGDSDYTLPTASTTELGGVKVDGTTITITDGVISSVGGGTSSGGVGDSTTGDTVTITDSSGSSQSVVCSTGAEIFNSYIDTELNSVWYYKNIATGKYSHAEGLKTLANGDMSHAEGNGTQANRYTSHSEGWGTTASGDASHAEGKNTIASSMYSHAEGFTSIASGHGSHAEGMYTTSLNYQHAQGHYNNNTTATAGVDKGTSTGTAFCIGNGTSDTPSNAFRVTYDGNIYATGTTINTGADYAEYFEWEDSNYENEDRIGYFVTLNGKKIKKVTSNNDYILGVVTGTACIIGNGDEDWRGKFICDNFGRLIYETFDEEYEETTHELNEETNELIEVKETKTRQVTFPKVNPEYDKTREYTQRSERQEWNAVGMLGMLYVRDDGTCEVNGFCTCNEQGIATTTTYSRNINCYRVVERITDNVIQIIFK